MRDGPVCLQSIGRDPEKRYELASFQKRPSKSTLTGMSSILVQGQRSAIVSDLEKERPEQHCDVVGCDEEVQ